MARDVNPFCRRLGLGHGVRLLEVSPVSPTFTPEIRWIEADKAGWTLSDDAASKAIAAAERRNIQVVVESALSDLSGKDRDFLDAMSMQDGPSTAGQVGQIIKSKPNVVSKYRNRLIAAGLIETAGYGKFDFAIPGLRQYLRS